MGLIHRTRVSIFSRVFLALFALTFALHPGAVVRAQTSPLSPNSAANNPQAISTQGGVINGLSANSGVGNITSGNGVIVSGGPSIGSTGGVGQITSNGNQFTVNGSAKNVYNGNAGSNSAGSGFQYSSYLDSFFNWIYDFCVGLGGIIAGLGGAILDNAMYYLVLHMGCWFTTANASTCGTISSGSIGSLGAVVNNLWKVVRDIFNLLFIFSLIYIGIRTILYSDDSGAQKAIGLLIAAALLINFSLYITKAIVDVSDYLAVSIFSVATQGISGNFNINSTAAGGSKTINSYQTNGGNGGVASVKSLSGAYMNEMKISSWFGGGVIDHTFNALIFSVVVLFFALFLGLILAYGGILLVARFITLMILMIFSPAMFLGWILPQFNKFSKDWWNRFLKSAFFAPAYIFMLYLGLYALTQFKQIFTKGYSGAFATNITPDDFSIFLLYVVGVGFLIAATRVAESMSKAGSATIFNAASGAAKWGAGYVGNSAIGSVGKWTMNRAESREAKTGKSTRITRNLRLGGEKLTKTKLGKAPSYKEHKDFVKSSNQRASRLHAVRNLEQTLANNAVGSQEARDAIAGATNAQIEQLAQSKKGREILSNHAQYLKKEHVKAIRDSKEESITDDFKNSINTAHEESTTEALFTSLGGSSTANVEFTRLHTANKDQLEKLGIGRLSQPQNAVRLTKKQMDMITELRNDGKMDAAAVQNLEQTRNSNLLRIAQGQTIGTVTRDSLIRKASAVPDLPDNVVVALSPHLNRAALRALAQDGKPDVQRDVRTVLLSNPSVQAPTPPAGTSLSNMDPGTMTPGEQTYMFLHFDPVGKDLGQ